MPELPEVESLKRILSKNILNKKIVQVIFDKKFNPKLSSSKKKISASLLDQKIKDVRRSAKILIFTLTNDLFMIIHLKMSGQIIAKDKKGTAVRGGHPMDDEKFLKFTIVFNDKSQMLLNDPRRFAYVKILNKKELSELIKTNGVEPLNSIFTTKNFSAILDKKPNEKIKLTLMNQKLIAGIGNIYSNEICFAARISPLRQNKTLNNDERKKLHTAIKKILKQATARQTAGKEFNYKVYQRQNKTCARCASKIKTIRLGGRSAFFCPLCQK